MVETCSDVDGSPSILRIETTGQGQKIKIPPFIKILREVTGDPFYDTSQMANKDYKMPDHDKEAIQAILEQEEKKAAEKNQPSQIIS